MKAEPDSSCNDQDSEVNDDAISISDGIEALGFGKYNIVLLFYCGLVWIGDATEMVVISLLGQSVMCEWNTSEFQVMLLSVLMFGGTVCGSIIIGKMSDTYGRKKVILVSTVFILVYGLLSALASNFLLLAVTRFVLGISLSSYFQTINLMLEFTPMKYRAGIICLLCVPFSFGTTLESLLAGLVLPQYGWRIWLIVSIMPYVLILWAINRLPESIRFLSVKGEKAKIMKIFREIAAQNKTSLNNKEIKLDFSENRGRLADLFVSPYLKFTACLASSGFLITLTYVGLQIVQPVLHYHEESASVVRCRADVCGTKPFAYYVKLLGAASFEFIAAPCAAILLYKIGRRNTITTCAFMSSLSIILLVILFNTVPDYIFVGMGKLFSSVVLSSLFIFISEVFPTPIRGVAVGIVFAVMRSAGIWTCLVSQYLVMVYGKNMLLILGISALASSCIIRFVPETKDKQLSDVVIFERQKS